MTEAQLITELAEVAGKALYDKRPDMPEEEFLSWCQRKPRVERIQNLRDHWGVPSSTPDSVVLQAISEDWDLS